MRWLAVLLLLSGALPQADMLHRPFKIGAIDYFGYDGIDLAGVKAKMPLHVGDSVTFASFDKKAVMGEVSAATGHGVSDVALVCCRDDGTVLVYVGLDGKSSRPLAVRNGFAGSAPLPKEAVSLYEREVQALGEAVAAGRAGEDYSGEYPLSVDPQLRKVQVAMHEFAAAHADVIAGVLAESKDARQRVMAAELEGYAPRSEKQVKALSQAASDPDSDVRNNAVRALGELAAKPMPMGMDPQPFVAMLFSGRWTDRNKASWLLERVTEKGNADVLAMLRQQAMEPLIEGASWDEGHAFAFKALLSRCLGMPLEDVQKRIASGDVESLRVAARAK